MTHCAWCDISVFCDVTHPAKLCHFPQHHKTSFRFGLRAFKLSLWSTVFSSTTFCGPLFIALNFGKHSSLKSVRTNRTLSVSKEYRCGEAFSWRFSCSQIGCCAERVVSSGLIASTFRVVITDCLIQKIDALRFFQISITFVRQNVNSLKSENFQ
jgi:hypothetical protein